MGSSTVTLAYDLDAKYIIHAVVPKWIDGRHNEYELLCTAYLSALSMADIMNCDSIAFPLLASGNNRFDIDYVLDIAIESFNSYRAENPRELFLSFMAGRLLIWLEKKGLIL